jgi:SAM-dependent methyltransferase
VFTKYHLKDKCEICGSSNLYEYFNLGDVSLVGSYRRPNEQPAEKVPLGINYCADCSNSQINYIVDAEFIFSDYVYHSSISETLRIHFAKMAEEISRLVGKRKLKCLDIASNDGCLLLEFAKHGWNILGVEPAHNLVDIAINRGVPSINSYWGTEAGNEALSRMGGKVDVITATNVFPHVEDSHGFLRVVSEILDDDGVFVIEGSYAKDMIEDGKFDLIFHEHIYYLLVKPLIKLLDIYNMQVYDLLNFHLHCGSLRIIAIKKGNKNLKPKKDVIEKFLKDEEDAGMYSVDAYYSLGRKAEQKKKDFISIVKAINKGGKKIIGYGAASKANVFLNYCGIGSEDIAYIVDDTLDKQGKLFPGTDIHVVPYDRIKIEKPDYIWVSAWDFTDEIIAKIKKRGDFHGKYIVCVTTPKVI